MTRPEFESPSPYYRIPKEVIWSAAAIADAHYGACKVPNKARNCRDCRRALWRTDLAAHEALYKLAERGLVYIADTEE